MNEKKTAPKWLTVALPILACVLLVGLAVTCVYPAMHDFRDRGVTEAFATPAPDTTPSPDEKLYP